MNAEPNIGDVLNAVHELDRKYENRFGDVLEAIQQFSGEVDQRFDEVKTELKGEISGLKGEIVGIKATMVTKDYLDDKLADLRGEFVSAKGPFAKR